MHPNLLSRPRCKLLNARFASLQDLKTRKTPEGKNASLNCMLRFTRTKVESSRAQLAWHQRQIMRYCKRIQFMIQDLMQLIVYACLSASGLANG